MRSKSAEKVKLSSFDDLFGKEEPVSGESANPCKSTGGFELLQQ